MRLFLALDAEQEIKNYLMSVQRQFSSEYAKLSFVHSFHTTLRFFANIQEEELEKIKECLRQLEFEQFSYTAKGIGYFKRFDKISTIWCGLEPKEKITELKEKIDNSLKEIGLTPENRFHPHITIARVKKNIDDKALLENIKVLEKKEIKSNCNSVVLYKSHLTPQGPIYSVVERFRAKHL